MGIMPESGEEMLPGNVELLETIGTKKGKITGQIGTCCPDFWLKIRTFVPINTYSLLETERLLKEKKTASGKTKEEAIMLLNHKEALDFILDKPGYLHEISLGRIMEIHALLTQKLGVGQAIRHHRVGITGTNYQPLDNEFQIREALEDTCRLVNAKENVFEKALLTLVLLSYIQAFTDGNKRAARIMSNGILIAYGYCPISFRSVDSIDYKKAMLIFYEQNNIASFKQIFIEQFLFAVKTYF